MPQLLYAGGELDSVIATGTVVEDTGGGRFDNTYARCGLTITGNASTADTPFLDASANPTTVTVGQTLYYHFEMLFYNTFNSANQNNFVELCDSSGNPWIALRVINTDVYAVMVNTGTGAAPVWTQLGASFNWFTGVRWTVDFQITLGSPHTVNFILNNTPSPAQSGTFTNAGLTNLAKGRHRGATAGGSGWAVTHSQMLAVEGKSTVGGKVKTTAGSGAGTNSGWTGAVTDVNEIGTNDSTLNAAAAAGLDQSYAWGDVVVGSGMLIYGAIQFMRAKNDGATPANIKGLCRSGATNYASAYNAPGIGVGFSSLPIRWDTDPATAVRWTQTGFNAAEFGYRSAA